MGFWGIEVKPGKKVSPFVAADALGKLRITQATLGQGSSNEKSTVLCLRDQKSPIFLCTLLPDKNESSSLDLELDEDDSVIFSVVGGRSVHLAGYFMEEDEGEDGYGMDDLGEDMAGMGSEESSDYDSEGAFEDDLSDDDTFSDDERFKIVPNSGVVIEEIVDDDKAANGNSQSKQPKKTKRSESVEKQQQGQIVPRTNASAPVLESEDEDGFPTSKAAQGKTSEEGTEEKEIKKSEKVQKKKKRDLKTVEQDDQPDRKKKTKKQKKADKEGKDDKEVGDSGTAMAVEDQEKANEVITEAADQEKANDNNETQSEKKKKKKKKKKSEETQDQPATTKTESSASTLSEEKPSQVRTFPNGLVVEELAMGKPDGKRADPGKQVSVHYIGKLQKNGKIFDSNVGRAPFKFRLGIGQVIKGWDVGVKGMRVGDKRRLTIPPSMGYGAKGAGGTIPPNSWLMFDVELVDVR